MATTFWKQFAACIRAKHPGFFMYGEAFDYSPDNIGQYTWPQNGGISLLDFPLRGRIADVFEHSGSDYATLLDRLYLTNGPYANPYELVTFYDNHDMARLKASDAGFTDANHKSKERRVGKEGGSTGRSRGYPDH